MNARITLLTAAALGLSPALAQQPPVAPAATGSVQPPDVPATVSADRRVAFQILAPTASSVEVALQGRRGANTPMQKDANGVWTATVGPLDPERYEYAFVIGGARVNAGSIDVPGTPPRAYELRNVPHGSVTALPYAGRVQKRPRNMLVYLPPQYFAEPNRRFPVLYLFSGMGEEDWTRLGRANLVFDNLIADGKAVPAIVVMPNNTTGPVPVPALDNAAIMEREITGEIVPMIEKNFRTIADRDHRAIAGLSFGGGTAFTIGMRHLDMFGTVGEFGTGVFGGAERTTYAPGYVDFDPDKITPGLYGKLTAPATKPHVFFMTVGTEDPRAPFQQAALDGFRKHGVQPVWHTYPGGHEMKVFRASLIDLVPLLFK